MLRKTLFVIALILLVALAWTGIRGGLSQLSGVRTAWQTAQTVFQFVYGLFAVLSVATIFRAQGWNRVMLACFTIALALAGGLGAVVWGEASVLVGIVSGGAAGLVGAGIAWLLRIGARRTLLP